MSQVCQVRDIMHSLYLKNNWNFKCGRSNDRRRGIDSIHDIWYMMETDMGFAVLLLC